MATSIPPHNAAELCDAALHLIDNPDAQVEDAAEIRPGPGFPDRRHHRRVADAIAEAYRPAAARSACARAGTRKTAAAAPGSIVVTEIPYLVQKSRLIEKIAELLNEKKLPLLADIRDELAEDIRIVIEPKSRTVDPAAADGIAVQADRAREPHSAEHERADQGQGAAGDGPRRVPARMARPSPRRAGAPLQASPRRRSSTGSKCSAAI